MKIIKPSAKLIGLMHPMHLTLAQSDGEVVKYRERPEQLIEQAGRVCYKSEDKITDLSYEPFIEMIAKKNHESVLEHSSASFQIVCDRGISHEIVRHRIASFSQESTRYCNYGKDKFDGEISVIRPPGIERCDIGGGEKVRCDKCLIYLAWERAVQETEDSYLSMLKAGCTPQIARSVLPTCLKTELVMTANFREWKHFIHLRTDKSAHPQMREIADMIKDILVHVAPVVFKEFI